MASKETDALVRYLRDSRVPAVVTSIDDGAHTPWRPAEGKYGTHFAPGTGGNGLAIDVAHERYDGKRDTPELLRIYRAFVALAMQGLLQELYYAGDGADWCVWRGQYVRWIDVPKATREVIRATHHDHVHVAVRKGVIVKWVGPTFVNPTPGPEEDDMPKPETRVAACRAPEGGVWTLTFDGGVRNTQGAPFYGSYPGLPVGERQGARNFIGIEPAGPKNADGYVIIADDDNANTYTFNPTVWERIKPR